MSKIRWLLAALGVALVSLVPVLGASAPAGADPPTARSPLPCRSAVRAAPNKLICVAQDLRRCARAVERLVKHRAPAGIREHRLCLRRRGCSFVVLAYELLCARRGCRSTLRA